MPGPVVTDERNGVVNEDVGEEGLLYVRRAV